MCPGKHWQMLQLSKTVNGAVWEVGLGQANFIRFILRLALLRRRHGQKQN